jgi:hypothetical protein
VPTSVPPRFGAPVAALEEPAKPEAKAAPAVVIKKSRLLKPLIVLPLLQTGTGPPSCAARPCYYFASSVE